MKILLLTFLCVVSTLTTVAQNKTLGVGTPTPNPNAALHVESPTNNQGFIMPRLTTLQRTGMGALLTTADNGLMLYDTDLKTIYIWDGAVWKSTAQVAGGSKLSYPYEDIVTTNPGTVDLFALKYNATDNARVMRIENQSVTNGSSALSVSNQGVGLAGYFQVNNATSGSSALYGTTNSNLGGALAPVGVYGESSGTGSLGGAFWTTNAANTFPALFAKTLGTSSSIRAETATGFATIYALQSSSAADKSAVIGVHDGTGTGLAGLFQNTNAANTYPAIQAETAGIGHGVKVLQSATSLGSGVGVFIQNTTSTAQGVTVDQQGLGSAANLNILNATSTATALSINHAGTGNAITANRPIQATSFIGDGSALTGVVSAPFTFPYTNTNTTAPNGSTLFDLNSNPANPADIVAVAQFSNLNTGALSNVLKVNNAGIGALILATSSGTGSGGFFQTTNAANTFPALRSSTIGTGIAFQASINNATSTANAILGTTNGTGSGVYGENTGTGNGFAGLFSNTNATNTFPAIQASTAGTGTGVRVIQNATSIGGGMDVYMQNTTGTAIGFSVDQLGLGNAGRFVTSNPANNVPALYSETNGTSEAGVFVVNNPLSTVAGLRATTNGSGSALSGVSTGIGAAGRFEVFNPASTIAALFALTDSNSGGAGVAGHATGTQASGGAFRNLNAANPFSALYSTTLGTGAATLSETSTGYAAIHGKRDGATNGNAGRFEITNAGNAFPALQVNTVGTGGAGNFVINNAINPQEAVVALTNGTGNAIAGIATGTGRGGYYGIINASNSSSALEAETNGTGSAIKLIQSNNGNALEVAQGGLKLSVATISAGGTITQIAAIYKVTTNATVTLPAATDGQVCMVDNSSGGAMSLTGLASPGSGKFAWYIYLGGWRPML